MQLKEYIESGLLEAYILGALSAEERERVAKDIATYPELAAEAVAIEDAMYGYAQLHAVPPPADLKNKIKAKLDMTGGDMTSNSDVRPFEFRKEKDTSWQRAAVWVLLITTVTLGIMLFSQRNSLRKEILAQNERMDSLLKKQESMAILLENREKENEMMADTATRMIVMKTMQPAKPMAATVYWSQGQGAVYMTFTKMPMPPQGKQYQLWVIQDGKPVSMGMVPNDLIAKGTMMKVPMAVSSGQAFAISLEKEGGSPTPTEVQVLGKTS